jgi:hypothetical protein
MTATTPDITNTLGLNARINGVVKDLLSEGSALYLWKKNFLKSSL